MKIISKSEGLIYGNLMEYPLWTSNAVYLLGFYFQARKFCVHFQWRLYWAAMGKYEDYELLQRRECGVMCLYI